MKLVKVRLLTDIDPDVLSRQGVGATFGSGVLKAGSILEVEDHGEVNGQQMFRYCPPGSMVDTKLPNDFIELIQE